jgi:O-antigen/teichoic acid export membrane protein
MALRWPQALEQRFKALTFARSMYPMMAALAMQFLAFVVTARGLGAEQFGVYTAILAVALVGADLVGFGAIDLVTRAVARNKADFSRYFGHLILATVMSWPLVSAIGLGVAMWLMKMTLPVLVLAAAIAAETLNGRLLSYLEAIMVAHGDPVPAAWVRLAGAASRLLVATLYFAVFQRSDVQEWVLVIVVLCLGSAALCHWTCVRRYGRPRWWIASGEIGAGWVFCVTQIALTLQNNVDRAVLTRHAPAADVGAYGAAMRILQLGFFPLQVATRITFPRFFDPRHVGAANGIRFAARVALPMLALGVGAGVLVAVASAFVPWLLGTGYAGSQVILLVLAVALPIVAIQTPPADALIAANLQSVRAACYWCAVLVFIALAWWGSVSAGAWGIAWAYVASQVLLTSSLWLSLWIVARGRAGG